MEQQVQSVFELAQNAQQAAGFISNVAKIAGSIDDEVQLAREHSASGQRASGSAAAQIAHLTESFVTVIRQSELGDRRWHQRWPVEIPVCLHAKSGRLDTKTLDISAGGLQFAMPQSAGLPLGPVDIEIEQIGKVKLSILSFSPLGAHCCYVDPSPEFSMALEKRLFDIEKDHRPLIDRVVTLAEIIGKTFDNGVTNRKISEKSLFDVEYRPIRGTDPVQYEVSGLGYLEAVLPELQEPQLKLDSRLIFCVVVDRNGYLPVHNKISSQPQRPGDPIWNAKHCRNKRIFNDQTGITAARNIRPFNIQNYARDMGGGQIVIMKELNAPIAVRGRHWGGLRMAYKL
jgi:methyl-accepting chemotaxis protein